MHKFLIWIKNIWAMVGVVLLLLMAVEFGFSLYYSRMVHPDTFGEHDSRIKADTYQNAPWVREYYKDFDMSLDASSMKWEPYVYWRRKTYHGKYINVNNQGLRYVNSISPFPKTMRPFRIFVFGGSTIWGTGVRDEFTIPALMQKQLTAAGIDAEVINFGETGYVSTQEVIELLLQLQKKNVPDIVVFYDGENDVFSAYQNNEAGLPQNEFNRRIEFNLRQKGNVLLEMTVRSIINGLSITRFIKAHWRALNHHFQGNRMLTAEDPLLASQVKDVYENNLMIADAFAVRYKFHNIFYWQPTIFGKIKLSMYEQQEKNKGWFLESLCKEVNDRIARDDEGLKARYDFHDISRIFHNVDRPLFVDWGHVGEEGNSIIAARMLKDILPVIHNNKGF